MGAGVGAARRRRGTTAGLFGAALLVAGTVLTSGGAYAQPSPNPSGHSTEHGEGDDRDGRDDRKGEPGKGDGKPKAGDTVTTRPAEQPAGPGTAAGSTPTAPGPTGSAPAPSGSARPAPAPGAVLATVEAGGAAAAPTAQGLQQALATILADKSLGTVTFAVADAVDGQLLYGSGENTPATPASTTKLATSIAALALIPGDTRLTTRVVQGAEPGTITLVGGGDPTLTALPADQVQIGGQAADADTAPASLDALARQTAAALKAAGTTTVKLDYDLSMYAGNPQHKNHDAQNIALVVPLMIDEGKVDPKSRDEAPARVADPAGSAAESFAALLRAQGVTVDGKAKPAAAPAAPGAAVLGRVDSPTVARLVERLLTTSDNQLAEAMARQVALAAHQPAGFEGAATAVTQELAKLGVPMAGVVLNDGSGLNPDNAIPPAVLVRLLALAASDQHPTLRPILTGLPIAGFTGTLGKRYGSGSGAADAAGLIRAKTGTLRGVNTLAGTVVDADGRLLTFAVMTRTTAPADTARAAMDRIAARLTTCGCH
ncbi:D-alanyl-D-alanine carboxypeptidase/D-alanyl-D-alanine-endopeptidase (penicillin-binding protein 4) [Kitasatospora sp. MAA19]|uniref:D-alanyl-D-alanine carboxypeptidase/D-alanyl-D-alanine endopeptidase n=1 Tax=Kitasatospora sp. MAA19 TaxID=3035090 RepID=UPI002473E623|nr:D-alanyl-D-alanine carboxypeptidase/D-alanyl-D-alanine-endopeptidase [Kitasatospora sp. MAA19]MDH6710435.1 D-alanyl-D-alanine carboxypeptidase/D-alanyl-D-alanine-endopeptidase (penicillin-binding protein 4) [Kitasatospora sp. MAA19]